MKNKLKICYRCNYLGLLNENVCPYCGVELISNCPACNAQIRTPFANFCAVCGIEFKIKNNNPKKYRIQRR